MTPCRWSYTFANLKKFGGDFFIVDPQAYLYAFDDRDRFSDPRFLKFLQDIEEECPAIKTFESYTVPLQELFLLEHTRHLSVSQGWLREITDQTGKIKIYDVNQCMQREKTPPILY